MKICITGKVGSGKTTAIEFLKKLGYTTYIVDEYIHKIYEKGQPGYQMIVDNFGKKFVNDKEVDRKKLGQYIFSNEQHLNKLNDLTKPLIYQWIKQIKDEDEPIFIELGIYLNHIKYFEKLFDQVIVIIGQEHLQNMKLNDLGWSKNHALMINPIKSTNTNNFITIDNNGTIENFYQNITKKISEIIPEKYWKK